MSRLQQLPSAAEEYGREQRAEILAAVNAVSRLWRRMGDDFDASYERVEPQLLTVVFTAQERVAAGALEYVPEVMSETGQRVPRPAYAPAAAGFVGVAGDGLPVSTLLYGGVINARQAVARGATVPQALASGGQFLSTATGTLLSDTGRGAEKLAGGARRVKLWTRMLEPPSCGRCVILAGKTSAQQEAFLRHPRCDCRNVPSSESLASDVRVDPRGYFDSLSESEQARLLGSEANARAAREGADLNQLVNAYRGGVREAQVNGRGIKFTTEGTTRRGYAYSSMSRAEYVRAQGEVRRASRRRQLRAPRMMPETIYQVAKGEADAQRLLKLYGWVL